MKGLKSARATRNFPPKKIPCVMQAGGLQPTGANIRTRAIGWLGALEGGCLREELEGFGAMRDVVVERGVE